MLHFSRWKIISIVAATLLSIIYALPNFLPPGALDRLPSWWPKQAMSLGLDLKGGSYLLLEANVSQLKKEWFDQIEDDVRARLRKARIQYTGLGATGDLVRVRISKPEELEKAKSELASIAQPVQGSIMSGFSGGTSYDLTIATNADGTITITPTEPALLARVNNGMASLISVLGQRINALGTTEPTIVRQGAGRIVVQVPGLDNPERLKELIGKTAKLSFHEVDSSKSVEEAVATGVPPGSKLFEMERDDKSENSAEAENSAQGRQCRQRRGSGRCAAELRQSEQRACGLVPVQYLGRAPVRQVHAGQCRPALCHRSR